MNNQFKKAVDKIKSGEQTIHLMPVYGFNFQLGRLNLLLGSPGAGKSLMTMHVMLKAMSEQKRILLLSSEMSIYQYTIRILKHELGILGEQIATNYLKSQNYEILNRNFSCKQGEIDIIAKDNKEYVFVEVKTRTNSDYGEPVDSVNKIKQKHLKRTIEYYIYINKLEEEAIRMDIIEIYIADKNYVHHIKNVF